MKDFRMMERELVAALEADGVEVGHACGDVFAVVACLADCGHPDACRAGIGPYGRTECRDCDVVTNLNAHMTTINITQMAKRLCEL